MKNIKKIELGPTEKADKARDLVIKKENALNSIKDMKSEITRLISRIGEIDSDLNSLLGLNTAQHAANTGKLKRDKSAIPQKGLVKDMAAVMSEKEPKTIDEIVKLLKEVEAQKEEDERSDVKPNSIRSYLANLDCFKCIKKNDPRYSKKGWICRKAMLE